MAVIRRILLTSLVPTHRVNVAEPDDSLVRGEQVQRRARAKFETETVLWIGRGGQSKIIVVLEPAECRRNAPWLGRFHGRQPRGGSLDPRSAHCDQTGGRYEFFHIL